MIIQIGTEVDESKILWKYKEEDDWRRADIDELIEVYESIVKCKNCEFFERTTSIQGICKAHHSFVDMEGYCYAGVYKKDNKND